MTMHRNLLYIHIRDPYSWEQYNQTRIRLTSEEPWDPVKLVFYKQ